MADYPELIPDRIGYDFGALNLSEETTTGGGPIRFRHSLSLGGHTLALTYRNRTLTEMQSLRDHYDEADGTHRQFEVPTAIWGTAAVVNTDSLYRYAEPPQEEHLGVFFNFTVRLRVVDGISLLFDLQGGDANQSEVTPTAFTSFAFAGNAPFILNGGAADPDDPAATLILQGKGADR